jgi:hypothetical protein
MAKKNSRAMKIRMELAIPILAVGWLYKISTQSARTEAFSPQPVQSSEKFYQPKKPVRPTAPESDADFFTDMAGRRVRRNDVTSQNTVPFFGRTKAVGPERREQTEQTMDVMTGGASLQISKTEVAPLFSPDENVQFANGTPNNSDFYQSRVNPGESFRNVKPFQDVKVGPGLGQGYTGGGTGGYNSALDMRSSYMDKNVDELRVESKPKASFTYDGHMGPAVSGVTNRGITAPVEKHLPDRYFVNTPDRYLTTVGAEVAPTFRSKQEMPEVHRVHTPYVGTAGNSGVQEPPQKSLVQKDHRQQFTKALNLNPAHTAVEGSNLDAEQRSMTVYDNNRSTMQPERSGNIMALVSAITAPITDLLRPNRKENTLEPKHLGNPAPSVQNLPLLPSNVALRAPTLYSPYDKGMRPHKAAENGGYQVTDIQIEQNQRSTTHAAYTGIASGAMFPKPASYEADYNAVISTSRENEDRVAVGSTNLFTGSINQAVTNSRVHVPSYGGGPTALFSTPPAAQFNETRAPQNYDTLSRNEPDILEAFKKNPYTHSLSSVA